MPMPVTPVSDGGELLGSLTYFGLCTVNILPCGLNRKETIANRRGRDKATTCTYIGLHERASAEGFSPAVPLEHLPPRTTYGLSHSEP